MRLCTRVNAGIEGPLNRQSEWLRSVEVDRFLTLLPVLLEAKRVQEQTPRDGFLQAEA